MKDKVKCSVVIPTYNRCKLLTYTLNSLSRQNSSSDPFEIIVVDDGSSDDSLDAVRNFKGDIDIRYIWKTDQGFRAAEARNCGVKLARGEIIIFVDSGVLVGANFIKSHLITHQSSVIPAAVLGYVYGFSDIDRISLELANKLDPDNVDSFIAASRLSGQYRDGRETIYDRCEDRIDSLPTPWCLFWTCNVSVPKQSIIDVGYFDEGFKSWGGEDVELGYRFYQAGLRYVLSREAAAVHYPHDEKARSQLDAFISYRYFSRKHKVSLDTITGMALLE